MRLARLKSGFGPMIAGLGTLVRFDKSARFFAELGRPAFQVQQCNNPHKHWVFVRFRQAQHRYNTGATGATWGRSVISSSVFSIQYRWPEARGIF